MLSSLHMSSVRALLATLIVAVIVLGPALFMASSPCLDCDGVCGAAATSAPLEVRVVAFVLPLVSDARTDVPPAPIHLAELPPRPLPSTV